MRRLLLKWGLMAVAFVGAAHLCDALTLPVHYDLYELAGFFKFLIGLAILGFLNATLGRLLKFLMLPLNCLTFGLVGLVVNAAMLMIASNLSLGFSVNGSFFTAFVCSLFYSGLCAILQSLLPDKEKEKKDS